MSNQLRVVLMLTSLMIGPLCFAQEGHEHAEGDRHGHGDQGHGTEEGHGHGSHGPKHGGGHGDLHAPGHHRDFSDVERWSKIFDAPERDAWQRPAEVVELMAIEKGMAVADLGAGTGYFLPHLSAAVGESGRVYGLDIEQSLVDHMQSRAASAGMANTEARVIGTGGPGLPEKSVDRLLIVNTWHHLDDRPNYTREIGRVLKAGGQLIIVDYTMESEAGPPKRHRLAPERVIAEIEAGGLVAEQLEEELPRQYVIVARNP